MRAFRPKKIQVVRVDRLQHALDYGQDPLLLSKLIEKRFWLFRLLNHLLLLGHLLLLSHLLLFSQLLLLWLL